MATNRFRLSPAPWVLLLALAAGCATTSAPGGTGQVVLLAFDDGRTEGSIAFPSTHHEGVVRFELPPGAHRLVRLWVQAAAPGTLRWALYDQTPLEGPGEVLNDGQLVLLPGTTSSGQDGRWTTVDLSPLPARSGVLWLGLKRLDGEPTINASRVDSGQYFVRSHDPTNPLSLMPVKRTPLVRLEIAP
jgi:hypothetical protein